MARQGTAGRGVASQGRANLKNNKGEKNMKKIAVSLKGISPLLMHKYPLTEIVGFEKLSAEEQAEHCAYRDPNKNLCIYGEHIQRALVSGATYVKGKGRASMQKVACACVFVEESYIPLGVKEYIIDSRRVVIPGSGGSIIRHRPKIEDWEIGFTIHFDQSLISEKNLRDIVDATISRVGFLDFRPEKKGPFGRSIVTKWETV